MLRDLDTGGRTEVEAIHGAVVATGEALGIGAPATRVVAALLRARERQKVPMDERRTGEDQTA
jgi:2-dehydropantoate 2-reductase